MRRNYNVKKILILGGSEFQIPLVKCAKEKGFIVGVVDINKNAPACKYADYIFEQSLKDREAVLEVAKQFSPDGITVGMVDVAVQTCAYVLSKLNLPGMDEETAFRATDKHEMIKAFKKYGVPHPEFVYISKGEIDNVEVGMGYPLIVKPVDMAGSRGIFLVNSKQELRDAIVKSSAISDRGDVIVEEYLDGPEVSVELVIKEGNPEVIQVTDKTTSGAPHFAEIGHLQPSQLSDDIILKIKDVACSAAKSLGLFNCLGHAEIKVTSKGPKMVEIGARAGGDGIAEQLIELSTGVSFCDMALQIAVGEEIIIPENRLNRASCIRFILSKKGKLESISGVDEARKIDGIVDININGVIGKQYQEMIDNSGRIGYVIASSDTAQKAKDACEEAIKCIIASYAQ